MKPRRALSAILFVLIGTMLVSAAPATRHEIDVQHSKMTVYVGKQGLFSFLGDNHEIEAPIASGVYDSAVNSVELTVDAAKLKALDPNLSADKRNTVQDNMVGPKVLDAGKYPTIAFRSTKIEATDPTHLKIAGNLTLHGQTHPIEVEAVRADATHFTGSSTVRQTSFGITPIKIAGGAVSVKDDVRVEFQVALGS